MEFEEINESADNYSANQGNHLVIPQENTIHQFPFIFGERISMLSLPDGKLSNLVDKKGIIRGLAYPSLQGDNLYFFSTWDSAVQGELYWMDIRKKNKPKVVAERVLKYTLNENEIFFNRVSVKKDGYMDLCQKNIQSNNERVIMRFEQTDYYDFPFLSIRNEVLFYFDEMKSTLYVMDLQSEKIEKHILSSLEDDLVMDIQSISDDVVLIAMSKSGIIEYDLKNNKKMKLLSLGNMNDYLEMNRGRYNIHQKNGNIYYSDKNHSVFSYNVKTKKISEIINWNKVDIVNEYIVHSHSARVYFYYCKDYIAIEVEDMRGSDHRIVTFNYEGEVFLNNNKYKLPDIGLI